MNQKEFLSKADELLKKLDEKSEKIEKRNNRAWGTISLLAVFFVGSAFTGIYKVATIENQKADKVEIENMYLKIERYESGQLMKSKLESAYMAKMAALAGGDSTEIKNAEKEYNYHIQEIIKFAGTRTLD
jgi:hypothetical protein